MKVFTTQGKSVKEIQLRKSVPLGSRCLCLNKAESGEYKILTTRFDKRIKPRQDYLAMTQQ